MLDFDIEWRPLRAVYIVVITGAIYYFSGLEWFPAVLALLAYFDFDPDEIINPPEG